MLTVSCGWISFSMDEIAEIPNLRITSISSFTEELVFATIVDEGMPTYGCERAEWASSRV